MSSYSPGRGCDHRAEVRQNESQDSSNEMSTSHEPSNCTQLVCGIQSLHLSHHQLFLGKPHYALRMRNNRARKKGGDRRAKRHLYRQPGGQRPPTVVGKLLPYCADGSGPGLLNFETSASLSVSYVTLPATLRRNGTHLTASTGRRTVLNGGRKDPWRTGPPLRHGLLCYLCKPWCPNDDWLLVCG